MSQKTLARLPADLAEDRVVPLAEVRAVTDLSLDTIRRAANRKELKLTRLSPRRCGVRKSELRRWLDQRTA